MASAQHSPKMPRSYGTRPRSLDILAPEGIDVRNIIEVLKTTPESRTFYEAIESIFQIGTRTFNITFRRKDVDGQESCREKFLQTLKEGILTQKGQITFALPTPPATRISIRGVPTEIQHDVIKQELEKHGCGYVCRMSHLFIKGTRIYNGYREIWVLDYMPNKLPDVIKIDNVNCKIYLPQEEQKMLCRRCLEEGHTALHCTRDIVCYFCKKEGHMKTNCDERERQFPALATRRGQDLREQSLNGQSEEDKIKQKKRPFGQVSPETSVSNNEEEQQDISQDNIEITEKNWESLKKATKTKTGYNRKTKKVRIAEEQDTTEKEEYPDQEKENEDRDKSPINTEAKSTITTITRVDIREDEDTTDSESEASIEESDGVNCVFDETLYLPPDAKRDPPEGTMVTAQLTRDIDSSDGDIWLTGKKDDYIYLLQEGKTEEYVMAINQKEWENGGDLSEAKRKLSFREKRVLRHSV